MTTEPHGCAQAIRSVSRIIRAMIQRSRTLRSIVNRRVVQHQIMTWRALTVVDRQRIRFLVRQLIGSRTAGYELRQTGARFYLRHRTGDVAILNKIFARDRSRNSYAPPAEVVAALGSSPRILDVGGNIGLFGVYASCQWPGAQIRAFEPDPDNLRVLRKTVAASQMNGRWTVVPAAVSNAATELSFVPGLRAKTHIADAHETGSLTVRAVDLFDQVGHGVDLIKMDIEGGEWAILGDPRLAALNASAIRLEWHTMLCPAPDAHAAAIDLLGAGGFTRIFDVEYDGEQADNGVLWAMRERPARTI